MCLLNINLWVLLSWYIVLWQTGSTTIAPIGDGFENCEVFSDSLQLRWTVERARSKIRFMLSGCQSTNVAWVDTKGVELVMSR